MEKAAGDRGGLAIAFSVCYHVSMTGRRTNRNLYKEDAMNRNRTTAVIYYVLAAVFYLVAVINFVDQTRKYGVIWLCLGSAWLCLGSVYLRKAQNEDDHPDSGDE